MDTRDTDWMQEALGQARVAASRGEVPIGAVAVADGRVCARAHNVREADGNPLGHAEILVIQQLVRDEGRGTRDEKAKAGTYNWRLTDITLYVTCEPCLMCAGALLQARVGRLVYGCADPKAGACGSLYTVTDDARLNHRIPTTAGVLAEECGALLSAFFRTLRQQES